MILVFGITGMIVLRIEGVNGRGGVASKQCGTVLAGNERQKGKVQREG